MRRGFTPAENEWELVASSGALEEIAAVPCLNRTAWHVLRLTTVDLEKLRLITLFHGLS